MDKTPLWMGLLLEGEPRHELKRGDRVAARPEDGQLAVWFEGEKYYSRPEYFVLLPDNFAQKTVSVYLKPTLEDTRISTFKKIDVLYESALNQPGKAQEWALWVENERVVGRIPKSRILDKQPTREQILVWFQTCLQSKNFGRFFDSIDAIVFEPSQSRNLDRLKLSKELLNLTKPIASSELNQLIGKELWVRTHTAKLKIRSTQSIAVDAGERLLPTFTPFKILGHRNVQEHTILFGSVRKLDIESEFELLPENTWGLRRLTEMPEQRLFGLLEAQEIGVIPEHITSLFGVWDEVILAQSLYALYKAGDADEIVRAFLLERKKRVQSEEKNLSAKLNVEIRLDAFSACRGDVRTATVAYLSELVGTVPEWENKKGEEIKQLPENVCIQIRDVPSEACSRGTLGSNDNLQNEPNDEMRFEEEEDIRRFQKRVRFLHAQNGYRGPILRGRLKNLSSFPVRVPAIVWGSRATNARLKLPEFIAQPGVEQIFKVKLNDSSSDSYRIEFDETQGETPESPQKRVWIESEPLLCR